jgi:anti-sigma regulatory factor (Ser/Thr protein kinase)
MLIPGETFSESYPAVPEAVAEARNALTAFAREAGANQEQLEAVRLSASEAVTNAVMHAYHNRAPGAVQVSASYVESEIWLLVADAGDGMRPRTASTGLGLGLALIAQLADELQILSRGTGGTELRLRFKLAPPKRRADRERDGEPSSKGQSPGSAPDRGSVSAALSPA